MFKLNPKNNIASIGCFLLCSYQSVYSMWVTDNEKNLCKPMERYRAKLASKISKPLMEQFGKLPSSRLHCAIISCKQTGTASVYFYQGFLMTGLK